jgi:hypothetical protein
MDTWRVDRFVEDMEYREDRQRQQELEKNRKELRYNLRYHRRAISDFKELVRSGRNPADFLVGEW